MKCKETLEHSPIVVPNRNSKLAKYLDDNLKSILENVSKKVKMDKAKKTEVIDK